MRFVKLLGVTIIIYGLSYMRYAVRQLYLFFFTDESSTELTKYILLNVNIGMVTFILGIGLILAKEWARITWLMSSIALLAINIVVLFLPRSANFTLPILNLVLIVLLSLISWLKLTRAPVKELFN
jgi:hypothetical protein